MNGNTKRIDTNIYSYLLVRIAVVMVLYALSRLIFIGLNYDLLQMSSVQIGWAMLGGLKFDISGIIYVNVLFILLCLIPFDIRHQTIYQKILHWVFVVFNSIGLAASMIDVNYFPFTLKRTTATIFQEFANEGRLGGGLGSAIFQFLPSFLAWVVMTFILVYISKRIQSTKPLFEKWYWNTLLGLGAGAALIGLSIAGIRGGFRHSTRPITLANAAKYIDRPIHRAAVLNTPFSMIRTIGNKRIKRANYFNDPIELSRIYDPSLQRDSLSLTAKMKNDNVMIIILESFSREHFGAYNKDREDYSGFTPFLDSLIEHSYAFARGFTNGRKSIDALPSVIAGIPKLERSFVLTDYSNNDINSIPSLLKPYGYQSAFFHGAPNGSMGFDAFINQANIDHYYGMSEYGSNDAFDGLWGIWDEPFFQYTAGQLDSLTEPFVSTLFSLSSHHPFEVPTQYEGEFTEGKIPLQEMIGYTDYCLKKFFDSIKDKPWYDNTLFVITNDHASGTDLPEYKALVGFFAGPMILFHPSDSTLVGWNDTTVVQHLDVMPTVLNYLNYPKPYLSFGGDMLSSKDDHFAFNATNGIYQHIEEDFSIQHDGNEITGIYNYILDPLLKNNLKDVAFDNKDYLIQRSFAVYQQVSNRMIDNELVLR